MGKTSPSSRYVIDMIGKVRSLWEVWGGGSSSLASLVLLDVLGR